MVKKSGVLLTFLTSQMGLFQPASEAVAGSLEEGLEIKAGSTFRNQGRVFLII